MARQRSQALVPDEPMAARLYRVAQEALANIREHARPRTIAVALADDGYRLGVTVSDDGCGFDVGAVRAQPNAPLHFGLDMMVERIRAAGGEAAIRSRPGAGTTVRFWVPTRVPDRTMAPAGV